MTIPEKKNIDIREQTACYELKQLDKTTLLLKIENLEEREELEITVETDYGPYKRCITIYGKNFIIYKSNNFAISLL